MTVRPARRSFFHSFAMQLSLALCIITAALSDALAPTRRRSALQKLAVGTMGLTTAQRAAAATNAEAEKVRVASRELDELLKNEDALRFKVLVEGSGTDSASFASPPPARHRCDATHDAAHAGKLPIAVSFITFQPVSKSNFGRPTLVAASLDGNRTHCLISIQLPEVRERLRRRLHGRGD